MAREKTDQERHPENYFTSPAGHPRDRIIIHESAEIPKEGVFLALNGYTFMAKPEVEIDLPRPVRLMLDTRIRTETRTTDDGKGNTVHHTRNIRRVPYTLIKENVDVPDPIPGAEVVDATQKPSPEVTFP